MEFRNVLGKIIKCIPVFMVLILAFVMRCELFHTTIYNSVFAKYPAVHCEIDAKEYDFFIEKIKELGDNGQGCIVVRWEKQSEIESSLIIYANSENIIQQIYKDCNISEGEYYSLLSGETSVEYRQIEELTPEEFAIEPYVVLLGNCEFLYDNLKDKFSVTCPEKMQGDETDMILIVWGLVSILLILANTVAVLRKKKEIIIRAVYGEDLKNITILSFIMDLVIFEILYIVAHIFVFSFISGDYKKNLAFIIYEIGCLIASSMNFLYLKGDIRAIFSNVQERKGILTFLYILKMTAFAIVLLTIATNLSSISTSSIGKNANEFLTECNKDIFITINGHQNESDPWANNLWDLLFDENYDKLNPKISLRIVEGEKSVLLMNENAVDFLPEEIGVSLLKESSEDIIILIPSDYRILDEDIHGILELYKLSEYKSKICEYEKKVSIPCVTNEETNFFACAKNPVIIYCSSRVKFNGSVLGPYKGIIYGIDEKQLEKLNNKLGISEQGYNIVTSNVVEVYEYQMNFFRKMISFLSSLCILVTILDLAITISLCNMEFRITGIEYAIKKVLGYSFWQRNKMQLLKMNLESFIVILMMAVLGYVTGIYSSASCMVIGVLIMAIENAVMAVYIIKYEKDSVIKMLKGGCL